MSPTVGQKFWKIERNIDGAPEKIVKLVFKCEERYGIPNRLPDYTFENPETGQTTTVGFNHWDRDYYSVRSKAFDQALEELDRFAMSRATRILELAKTKLTLESEQVSSNF